MHIFRPPPVPGSNLSEPNIDKYCMFLNNQTINFLPEEWGARWNLLAFQVRDENLYRCTLLDPNRANL